MTGRLLAGLHWTRTATTAVDAREEAVWFYNGPRLVLAAVVPATGAVPYSIDAARQGYAYGSNIANDPRMLALLCVIFVLVSAVWPSGGCATSTSPSPRASSPRSCFSTPRPSTGCCW